MKTDSKTNAWLYGTIHAVKLKIIMLVILRVITSFITVAYAWIFRELVDSAVSKDSVHFQAPNFFSVRGSH